jgi:hypothetical protein
MYNPIYFALILRLMIPYYTRMVAILFYLTFYEQRLILVCVYDYNTEQPELLSEILQYKKMKLLLHRSVIYMMWSLPNPP